MKKTVKLLWIVSLFLTALMIFSAGCKGEENNISLRSVYYANYGEWFVLPEADCSRVTAADGKDVLIDGNKVFIDRTDDYALYLQVGGKKYESVLKVNADIVPDIYVSKNIVYGVVNSETVLPEAVAHDGVKEISVAKDEIMNMSSRRKSGKILLKRGFPFISKVRRRRMRTKSRPSISPTVRSKWRLPTIRSLTARTLPWRTKAALRA